MFKKGSDVDKKKLLVKASDVKKDSLSRLKHFKTLIEHLDFNEIPQLFKSHFSFIYHTFIDTFSTFDCNSKQRRDDLDCILFMLEKILIFNPELIKKRWQFYSITFVMQKLLHQRNTWRLRQEGIRLFIIWYQILADDTNLELQSMFASIVPHLVPQANATNQQQQKLSSPTSPVSGPPQIGSEVRHQQQQQHSAIQNSSQSQLPEKLCTIDPLVPMAANEQLPSDETSLYLDSLLQFMVTQTTKPYWESADEARKNQELSFAFTFDMFKKIYLQSLFPNFNPNLIPASSNPLASKCHLFLSNSLDLQYMDGVSDGVCQTTRGQTLGDSHKETMHNNNPGLSPTRLRRNALQLDLRQAQETNYMTITTIESPSIHGAANEHERQVTLSIYQSIVIKWLTRIMRLDMIPGQDELIKSGGSSNERLQSKQTKQDSVTSQEQVSFGASTNDPNSTSIFNGIETTSREMEIARKVAGTWPENIAVLHELFRRAFLNYFQPASMKRVVNVYKEWICNASQVSNNSQPRNQPKLGYTAFGDLLQVFVVNSSNAFLTRVHSAAMLDEQVEMCKRIMNIYRYMVMKIYMNTATWEQLLNVMLTITEALFPIEPPEKKESTIGGRIAPAFFQTFIVSWIRANLYVHISNKMWNEFHRVMRNLVRWREMIEEWSTTMGSLTRVLVKHVYGLNLNDLPLDKPQDRRRRPRTMKSLSTVEAGAQQPTSSPRPSAASQSGARRDSLMIKGQASGGQASQQTINNKESPIRGLARSNSDGCLIVGARTNLYVSTSTDSASLGSESRLRRIKSEYQMQDTRLGLAAGRRSSSPSHADVLDGASFKEPNMIQIDSEQVVDSQLHGDHQSAVRTPPIGLMSAGDHYSSNMNMRGSPMAGSRLRSSDHHHQASQQGSDKTVQDKCVLLGGSIRGWTPENSVIMWRRMLGLLGNINHIESPESHLVALRCVAVMLCDFIKARENLGISLDNQSTPEQPQLIPPYTYNVGWLLEATHLPRQFKESKLTAYKLLCLMSIRRHDIELPQQYYTAFYEALYRGLVSGDPQLQASIVKNSSQLLSLELPGATFLVYCLFERSRSVLLGGNSAQSIQSSPTTGGAPPKDQAAQILATILALHRPLRKLMVLKGDASGQPMSLAAAGDLRAKIFDAFISHTMRPPTMGSTASNCQIQCRSLCSMSVHVFQELCDKQFDSPEVDKLFEVLLSELRAYDPSDSYTGDLFRIECDLLRLFAEHATSLAQTRAHLVSSLVQILCQLIMRLSGELSNKEAIHCLLICLEDWCVGVGSIFLLRPLALLHNNHLANDELTYGELANESLITLVLKSLDSVVYQDQPLSGEPLIEPQSRSARGSVVSHNKITLQDHHQPSSSPSESGSSARDRTMTNESQQRALAGQQQSQDSQASLSQGPSDPLQPIRLACKVSHCKLITYLGHFPLRQVGAASMSCCVNEADYLVADGQELTELKGSRDVVLLAVDSSTILSFVGGQLNANSWSPAHVIVRNLCGKYSWDVGCLASSLPRPTTGSSSSTGTDLGNSIVVDPDSFQQDVAGRSSLKYDSDFNDEPHSATSSHGLSSRGSSSMARDFIDDLLNQLSSQQLAGTSLGSSSQGSSPHSVGFKRRNMAPQSTANPHLKVASSEEMMIALLTNQRFQELNYCDRAADDSGANDKMVISFGPDRSLMTRSSYKEAANSNSVHQDDGPDPKLSFEQCRKLLQQLGYLSWEKRTKIDSLAKTSRLLRELKNLDSQPARETHKIAVIYVAMGQEDKQSILSNSNGSRQFEEFVSALGWEVNLSSHLGFKGGLQSNKSTGETSPYYCNSTTEVMFHCSTRIPILGQADDESLNRKLRHLGNDEVHIIWSEHSRDYRRGIIPTEFGDVIICVYPMLTFSGYFRIQVISKPEVPPFGPLQDNCIVHQLSLAPLVRATAINASRAKRFKLPYYQSHFEERSRLIETIAQNHRESLSFEEFAVQLYQPQQPAAPPSQPLAPPSAPVQRQTRMQQ